MDPSEKRIVAALLLLLGLTLLALGLEAGQMASVLDLIKRLFEPALAGF